MERAGAGTATKDPVAPEASSLIEGLRDLDARIAARGVTVTIGAEPTFTLASSSTPCWLWQADAPEKREHASTLAAALAARLGGEHVEIPGRTYPDEDAPRFCLAVRWGERALTVTPDPGVVEVNTAPCADGVDFYQHVRAVYAAAADAGLSPRRLRYNGDVVDSGGGGQLTIGGPSYEQSPFAVHPSLLPRMVRYFHQHPSLGYWFLGEMAGSASQSPRPDEGVRERWEELRVACAHTDGAGASIDTLWQTFAPLLVDAAGNSHRAELNVEKLASPHLGERGRMGVVELRAFRMPPTPEMLAAAAALVRAIAARCASAPVEGALDDWGGDLHDRMALPWFLGRDLAAVFADLADHGLGLGAELEALATAYRTPRLWHGDGVTISRALEFWPLIGDVASQERATSRLVDASSERLEVRARAPATIAIGDVAVPLREAAPGVWLRGLRRRVYAPASGLHPSLPAKDPLHLQLGDLALALHGWRPGGGAYDGLPADDDEAAARRDERIVVSRADVASPARVVDPSTWTVDLRGLC